jgi:CDP-diglyceride synthetase
MSPQIALHDSVFRNYLFVVLISLATGGALLSFLRFVMKKETACMFQTYWSWILIAAIGFAVVFLGRIPRIVGPRLDVRHLGFLTNARNAYGFICDLVFATAVSDVAAFSFEEICGRHRLRSQISPNKT